MRRIIFISAALLLLACHSGIAGADAVDSDTPKSAAPPSTQPTAAELGRVRSTLETKNYKVTITVNCPEGCVTCDDVTYEGLSKQSGKRITLKGSTWRTIGADGVTPSRFLGYQFKNGNITYIVTEEGSLQVFKGESNVLVEEQGTWSSADDDLAKFIYAGRPIHPGCIREFEHALADREDLPQSVITVDVESCMKSNKERRRAREAVRRIPRL